MGFECGGGCAGTALWYVECRATLTGGRLLRRDAGFGVYDDADFAMCLGWRVAQAMKEREGAREQQASVGIGQMGEVGEGKGISDMMGEAVEDVFRESRLAEQARERGKRE